MISGAVQKSREIRKSKSNCWKIRLGINLLHSSGSRAINFFDSFFPGEARKRDNREGELSNVVQFDYGKFIMWQSNGEARITSGTKYESSPLHDSELIRLSINRRPLMSLPHYFESIDEEWTSTMS